VCEGLGFLGIELEKKRNEVGTGLISPDGGRVAVHVIRTDEEFMIAKLVCQVLGLSTPKEI
jgi:acetate kinase